MQTQDATLVGGAADLGVFISMALSAEKKVGCIFIFGMIALGILTILIGNFNPFDQGNTYKIIFDNVRGLNVGDPVRLAGLEIGRVQNLRLRGDKIEVVITTSSNILLRKGCRIVVQDDTLIGGKILAISLPPETSEVIKPGTRLFGSKAETAKDVFDEVAKLSGNIRELVTSFNKNQDIFFNNINLVLKENKSNFKDTIENFNQMALDFQDVAKSVMDIASKIESGQGTAGKLISDDELYVNAKEITNKINRITSKVEEGQGTFGKLLRDDNLYNQFNDISSQLKSLTIKLNEIADKINKGRGSVGKFINEDTMYNKTVNTLDKAQQTFNDISDMTNKAKQVKVYLGARSTHNTERDETLSGAYIRLEPNSSKFYTIGAAMTSGRDVTKKNRDADIDLDLQIGKRFFNDKLSLRAGLLESRAGGGFDYKFSDRLGLTFEARDTYENEENIDNVRLRSYLEYRVVNGFYVHAGGDNLGSNAGFWVGGRYEFEDKDLKYLISLMGLGGL